MDSKIQELTDKILSEGIEKGKTEASKIIEEAKLKAQEIIETANTQAASIISEAKKEVTSLQNNTQNELKMFAQMSLDALKTDAASCITDRIVKETVGSFTTDSDFMKQFILKLAQSWGANESLVISTEDAAGLKAFFTEKAKSLLDSGLQIEEVHGQNILFTVKPADGSYKLVFGNEEFENYFKSFLRPYIVELLF